MKKEKTHICGVCDNDLETNHCEKCFPIKKDHTKKTLGELLSHSDNTIIRNATSILKRLQKKHYTDEQRQYCSYCGTEETPDKIGNCPNCGNYIK